MNPNALARRRRHWAIDRLVMAKHAIREVKAEGLRLGDDELDLLRTIRDEAATLCELNTKRKR